MMRSIAAISSTLVVSTCRSGTLRPVDSTQKGVGSVTVLSSRWF